MALFGHRNRDSERPLLKPKQKLRPPPRPYFGSRIVIAGFEAKNDESAGLANQSQCLCWHILVMPIAATNVGFDGDKRTWPERIEMSANDPTETLACRLDLSLQPFGSWESQRCQAAGRELRSMSKDPHTIGGSGQIKNVRRKRSA